MVPGSRRGTEACRRKSLDCCFFSGNLRVEIQEAEALPSRVLLESGWRRQEERGWRMLQAARVSCAQMTDDPNARAYDT